MLAGQNEEIEFEVTPNGEVLWRRDRSRPIITTVNDPDFDNKIQASIRQQIAEYQSGNAG